MRKSEFRSQETEDRGRESEVRSQNGGGALVFILSSEFCLPSSVLS
jgi:hypothetical protein